MIQSFRDRNTTEVFHGRHVSSLPPDIQARGQRKLDQIHRAINLDDLRTPPGNRLEPLRGDRVGQWSIRINQQWRVCFRWQEGHAYDVEITDYH